MVQLAITIREMVRLNVLTLEPCCVDFPRLIEIAQFFKLLLRRVRYDQWMVRASNGSCSCPTQAKHDFSVDSIVIFKWLKDSLKAACMWVGLINGTHLQATLTHILLNCWEQKRDKLKILEHDFDPYTQGIGSEMMRAKIFERISALNDSVLLDNIC